MKKWPWIVLALVCIALIFACNKQKPPVLDYEKSGKSEIFDQKGLPGESYVGAPPEDFKHRGYEPPTGEQVKPEVEKEKKQLEKKEPEKKKPEEKKPEEKKPEEKKPEEKKSEEKK